MSGRRVAGWTILGACVVGAAFLMQSDTALAKVAIFVLGGVTAHTFGMRWR